MNVKERSILRRWYFLIVGPIIILAIAFGSWFYFFRNKEIEGILEASGQVRGTEITISSRIAGRVERLSIKEGQTVGEGEMIAKISSDEIEAQLEQAEASALDVKAKEKEYQRLLDERDRIKASYEAIKNQIDSAIAKVKEIEATLKDTNIYAPSKGTIINRLAEEGELVGVGAPIALLIDLSDIYIKIYIPEKDIGKIRLGNPARIYADAFPDKFFEGSITEISQKAEFTPKEVHMKEERTKLVFGVKVGIENPEGYLKPGMPADVKIRWKEDVSW